MRWMAAMLLTMLALGAAHADVVPPFKGNDTGGIISTGLIGQTDVRQLASAHCAQYGKIARYLGNQRVYGGYLSFACKWVPVGGYHRPLRTRY